MPIDNVLSRNYRKNDCTLVLSLKLGLHLAASVEFLAGLHLFHDEGPELLPVGIQSAVVALVVFAQQGPQGVTEEWEVSGGDVVAMETVTAADLAQDGYSLVQVVCVLHSIIDVLHDTSDVEEDLGAALHLSHAAALHEVEHQLGFWVLFEHLAEEFESPVGQVASHPGVPTQPQLSHLVRFELGLVGAVVVVYPVVQLGNHPCGQFFILSGCG